MKNDSNFHMLVSLQEPSFAPSFMEIGSISKRTKAFHPPLLLLHAWKYAILDLYQFLYYSLQLHDENGT